MPAVKKTPLINSISGEPSRLEGILPIVAEFNCPVIALCMDDRGIPADSEGRMIVIRKVFEETRKAGILDKDMYVDPLAMTIATNTNAGNIIFETMRRIRTEFPEAHISCGLSNVSFGLPYRSLINRTFMVLALQAGMDTALIDPNDRDLVSAIYATELLLGKDRHCLNYTRAYRSGKIGQVEKI
jgi:5-methyltetrahydrofolate--homocysteine methyltransferase